MPKLIVQSLCKMSGLCEKLGVFLHKLDLMSFLRVGKVAWFSTAMSASGTVFTLVKKADFHLLIPVLSTLSTTPLTKTTFYINK